MSAPRPSRPLVMTVSDAEIAAVAAFCRDARRAGALPPVLLSFLTRIVRDYLLTSPETTIWPPQEHDTRHP